MDASSNKRLIKNTAFLYVRMILVLLVTLYTSRVILDTLGITDYGIYNVVGGIITMMTFINGALGASTSRFLTYELGLGDNNSLKRTFSATLTLHIFVAILVVIVGETFGLWFFYEKMSIPENRAMAAFWVYQFSIISTVFTITQVPYNASIISHENMSIYAYVGIYEALSKLAIAYLVAISPIDNLVFYAGLLMINSVLVASFYRLYTRKYEECRFRIVKDKTLYKKLIGYSGWDLFGGLAIVCQGQGINIILNMFFGPTVNAARAIAVQVQSGVTMFITNFMVATRPQVIKAFAVQDFEGMYKLTFYSAKFAYMMMLALVLPICFEMNSILQLWLGNNIPDNTRIFTILILVTALIETFHTATLMPYHAIGKIKTGNSICGTMMVMALPISYVLLKMGCQAYVVFIVNLVINTVCQIISWIIVHGYVPFSYKKLLRKVYCPCFVVTIISVICPIIIVSTIQQSWQRVLMLVILSEICCLSASWFFGLNRTERQLFVNLLSNKTCKN